MMQNSTKQRKELILSLNDSYNKTEMPKGKEDTGMGNEIKMHSKVKI